MHTPHQTAMAVRALNRCSRQWQNAGPRPPQRCLRPLIGSLWHLVCQKRSCQGAALDGSAENMGNLTFWHLVCQT